MTGTSTGIGKATSLRLASEGFNVIAGVRRAEDGDALVAEASRPLQRAPGKKGRIIPVILDVTIGRSIQDAFERVRQETSSEGLWALINNAGIVVGGPVEQLTPDDWRRQFDTNFFGWIEVIRAALPLLRQGVRTFGIHTPRIVLISSIAGRIAQPILAPYSCSKWATTALGDSLRLELRRQGIGVSVIEPGAIATAIWGKGEASLAEFGPDHPARKHYGAEIDALAEAATEAAATAIPSGRAADAILHALTAPRAPARVLVGQDAKTAALLRRWLPTTWFEFLVMRQFGIAELPVLQPTKAAS